jgi:hypothetical protein
MNDDPFLRATIKQLRQIVMTDLERALVGPIETLVDAGVYDDDPEEIGILQARLDDLGREWADLMRQLQGQPRRQSDVNADIWQPIATAPIDRVIDLWSAEGGRYPDAIWDVHCGVEGWTDANDHRSLDGYSFTHWMDRPAGPTEGGE